MSKKLGNFFHRKSIKVAIALAIVLLVIYPFLIRTKNSFADEISLYPTICEGSWNNASEAAGDPVDNRLIGARSEAAGDMITCHSFDASSLPKDAVITDAHFEFLWTVDDETNKVVEPSIEESYDPIAPLIETEPVNQESETEILDTEIIPSVDQQNLPESPEINSNDEPSVIEPTSGLPHWIQSLFVPEVRAQEEIVTPTENTQMSNETKNDTETNPQIIPSEINIPENISVEEVINESKLSEENTTLDKTNLDQTENSAKTADEIPQATVGETEIGIALYDIAYSISDKQQSLGQVIHEHLSKPYSVSLAVDDLASIKVSLTSLMTVDHIDNLALGGIKLVIVYNASASLDPIRQPDLEVDTVLDNVNVDNIQAIRIKRSDNEQYEIWYRTLDPEELTNNMQQEYTVDIKGETIISDLLENPIPASTDLVMDEIKSEEIYITGAEKSIIENSEKGIISTPTNTINSEIPSETKIPDKKKRYYWNYVDGDDSINRAISVAVQDGYIFWLNKKSTVLNSFNILTQGYNSQSYQPENGLDFIGYYSSSSQEKKAILNFSEQKFIFPE